MEMKLYYTITEAAELLGVQPHILRYWESELKALRPKRKSGKRFYTPDDLKIAFIIKTLIKKEGYTLNGARRKLRDSNIQDLIPHAAEALLLEIKEELQSLHREIKLYLESLEKEKKK